MQLNCIQLVMGQNLAFPLGQWFTVWFVCLCLPGIVSAWLCPLPSETGPSSHMQWKGSNSEKQYGSFLNISCL